MIFFLDNFFLILDIFFLVLFMMYSFIFPVILYHCKACVVCALVKTGVTGRLVSTTGQLISWSVL